MRALAAWVPKRGCSHGLRSGAHPKLPIPIPIPPPLTFQAGAKAVSAIASDRRARCATAAGRVVSRGVHPRQQGQLRRARRATAAKGGKVEGVHAGGEAESAAGEHFA